MTPAPQSRPHLFGLLAGMFLAAGISFASIIVTRTWTHLREAQVIEVTGSTRKEVRSDLVVWTARLSVEAPTLAEAYAKYKTDLGKMDRFLKARAKAPYELSPVQVKDFASRDKDSSNDEKPTRRMGYKIDQAITMSSAEVEALPKLAGDCSELLDQGVVLITDNIQFIYTKAGEAKVELMAAATQDARARAEQIATQGGRRVRELRSARMGVVQINPLYSNATSWDGNNDTTALEKTISVTVTARFALD